MPVPVDVKAATAQTYQPAVQLDVVAAAGAPAGGGVVVECVQESGRLRIHVVGTGYQRDWNACNSPARIGSQEPDT